MLRVYLFALCVLPTALFAAPFKLPDSNAPYTPHTDIANSIHDQATNWRDYPPANSRLPFPMPENEELNTNSAGRSYRTAETMNDIEERLIQKHMPPPLTAAEIEDIIDRKNAELAKQLKDKPGDKDIAQEQSEPPSSFGQIGGLGKVGGLGTVGANDAEE